MVDDLIDVVSFPRESIELLPVPILRDGVPMTSVDVGIVTLAVTLDAARPVTWTAPTVLGTQLCVLVSTLTPGFYKVWARISASPEFPVLEVLHLHVS